MAKRKQGWQQGLGKASQPVKLYEGPKLQDAEKGTDYSKRVYSENENPIRTTRKDTGT